MEVERECGSTAHTVNAPSAAAVAFTSVRRTTGMRSASRSRMTPPPVAVMTPSITTAVTGSSAPMAASAPATANAPVPPASAIALRLAGMRRFATTNPIAASEPPIGHAI